MDCDVLRVTRPSRDSRGRTNWSHKVGRTSNRKARLVFHQQRRQTNVGIKNVGMPSAMAFRRLHQAASPIDLLIRL